MSCLFRKDVLEDAGGFTYLGKFLAEDYYLGKLFLERYTLFLIRIILLKRSSEKFEAFRTLLYIHSYASATIRTLLEAFCGGVVCAGVCVGVRP